MSDSACSLALRERSFVVSTTKFVRELKELVNVHASPQQTVEILKTKLSHSQKIIANLFDISVSTVRKINKSGNCAPPSKFRQPRVECTSAIIKYIQRVTLGFYVEKKHPTLDKIRQECFKNPEFPRVGRVKFRRWLKDKCKFVYTRKNGKNVYLQREDIMEQRIRYTLDKREYIRQGYYIVFHDETWCFSDMSPSKLWLCKLDTEELLDLGDIATQEIQRDMNGYTGGFLVKNAAGRIIINHCGGKNGFVQGEGVRDVFISKTGSGDYHTSMNAEHFNAWFENLVKHLNDKTVVVLDRAPYHRTKVPTTIMAKLSWKTEKIIENLQMREIEVPTIGTGLNNRVTKIDLINASNQFPTVEKFVVHDIIDKSKKDIKILWLPVGHCEFNAIEFVWSEVKRDVAKNNANGGNANILELTHSALDRITPEKWSNYCRHVIEFEDRMWENDHEVSEHTLENITLDGDWV